MGVISEQRLRPCQCASEQASALHQPAAVTPHSLGTALCEEEGAIMRWRAAEYSRSLLGELVKGGKQSPDSAVMAPVQTEPQCSMARTSRYCVTG